MGNMMQAAVLSFNQAFSKPFRAVFVKALGLTFLLLFCLWFGVQAALANLVALPYPWLETMFGFFAGIGLLFGLILFIPPVTSLFAGIFLDEIAERVEQRHYPQDPQGVSQPFLQSLGFTLQFFILIITLNIISLLLVFVFGLGVVIFFIANGYLLGREYFEMIAMRFLPVDEVKALRREYWVTVFLSGLVIAGFLAIPIMNLLTPLFATAFMVHIFKMVTGSARPE